MVALLVSNPRRETTSKTFIFIFVVNPWSADVRIQALSVCTETGSEQNVVAFHPNSPEIFRNFGKSYVPHGILAELAIRVPTTELNANPIPGNILLKMDAVWEVSGIIRMISNAACGDQKMIN